MSLHRPDGEWRRTCYRLGVEMGATSLDIIRPWRLIFTQGSLRKHFEKWKQVRNHLIHVAAANFIAGAAAGCATLFVTYPLDIAHIPLAAGL
uniref:Uncharacterized protein n=1 Tax=Kalanchoe fedtschenkoi TaxID=63787 RepID=A0A7N1A7K2_KALFE